MRFLAIFLCAAVCWRGAASGEVRTAYPADLLGAEEAERYDETLPMDTPIEWVLRYPQGEAAARPPGILVYVSPTPSGEVPRGWASVLDDRNLIWVSANQSGNDVVAARRMLHAILSLNLIAKDNEIDATRVYVSGFSGGGKIASTLASSFAETFTGSLHVCGAVFDDTNDAAKRSAINQNGHVLLTGRNDFNRRETRQVARDLERAGATRVLLMDMPKLGHELPNGHGLEKAIVFLDERETKR